MTKLTDWFSWNVRPKHVGVYQRLHGEAVFYAVWNGIEWCASRITISWALEEISPSMCQRQPWRGLVKP